MDETLAELAAELRSSETAVGLTGAGVSVASGIPPFRGGGGIWEERFDPADFRIGRFVRDPAGFWADRLRLYEVMLPDDVRPNAAHEALARLEAAGYLDAVVTQNTDGLHLDAGSERVIELHGTNRRVICHACGRTTDAGPVRDRARDGELPPRCESCGGAYKPDVVLFGETLPGDAFREARRLAAESDVFFALGSSLTVEPAASLPAAAEGTLVVMNMDETRYDDRADYVFRSDVTDLLPQLAERVAGGDE